MELEDIKRLHDKAYDHGEVTRERAADDLVFAWVTQWDDNLLGETQLQYRGEFDILRKAIRQIVSQMGANPVQVDFKPKDMSRDDGAELLDGIYRTEDSRNTSIEAYDNAKQEQIVCGVGAWMLVNEYESNSIGNTDQVIRRKPIYEANNNLFWDPNAKRLDKSDAMYCSVIHPYSEDGYKELVHKLTGKEEDEINLSSFKHPEESYVFPWISESSKIYVGEFYYRELVEAKVYFVLSPVGQEMIVRDKDIEQIMDEMIDAGYQIVDEKKVERYQVTKYILSGDMILEDSVIPGEHIPVVPAYGERQFVEGEEHYEGITRKAKDPQRLRNFNLSYLADITSRSPREKPIFTPEQIQGFEFMYEESGSENNYPYLLQNTTDAAGNQLPVGQIGVLPAPNIPPALIATLQETRAAVEDVANPGLPQDIADPDASGKAIYAIQNRLDQQTAIYQTNFKHAKRRDGEIFASMSAEVFDTPRNLTITKPDGTTSQAKTMEAVLDEQTGEMIIINDVSNMEFDVLADISPSFSSQREQIVDRLEGLLAQLPPEAPERDMIQLKLLSMIDGDSMKDVRDFVNKQMLIKGYKEPETDEDKLLMQQLAEQQAQAEQKPDPAMVLAQAEMVKAQAQAQGEVNDANKLGIDQYNAETKRLDVQIKAEEIGANIENKKIDSQGKQIDNVMKLRQPVLQNINLRQAVN